MEVSKEFSSDLTVMKDMPNKYKDSDDTNSTTYEEKKAMKSVKKNSLDIAYIYKAVDTSKSTEYLAKACCDEFPEGIGHKKCILLNERFAKSETLHALEIREYITKMKPQENKNHVDFFEAIA